MDSPDWTIVVSGPLAQRADVLAILDRLEPDDTPRGHPHGLSDGDPSVGWVTCRHANVDTIVDLVAPSGWVLRAHWNTPECRACGGSGRVNVETTGLGTCLPCEGTGRTNARVPSAEEQLRAELDKMAERLAALEAK